MHLRDKLVNQQQLFTNQLVLSSQTSCKLQEEMSHESGKISSLFPQQVQVCTVHCIQ